MVVVCTFQAITILVNFRLIAWDDRIGGSISSLFQEEIKLQEAKPQIILCD